MRFAKWAYALAAIYGVTVRVLHQQGRTHGTVLAFASLDLFLGLLFTAAWLRTPKT